MAKEVIGRLESFSEAAHAVRDLLGAGFECESIGLPDERVVVAEAENEIMADRAVVILRRHGAADIDEHATD
jgi:hypothetical protein